MLLPWPKSWGTRSWRWISKVVLVCILRLCRQHRYANANDVMVLRLLLFVVFVLSSGAVYGNSFFSELVGHWNIVNKTTVADDNNSTFRYKVTMRVRKLKNGGFHTVTRGTIDGKRSLSKGWFYPKGTYRGMSYLNGEKIDEGQGRWSVRGKSRWVSEGRSSFGKSSTVTRRINRNKYVSTGRSSDGSRSTSTWTRIRK